MSRRRWALVAAASIIAVAGAVLAQLNDRPVGRETVARFLQVEPSSLQFSTGVEAPGTGGTDTVRELWLAEPGADGRPLRVWVDRTRNYVMAAQWGEGVPPEGAVTVSRDDALAVAREWASRAWEDPGDPDSTREPAGLGERAPVYTFRWTREGEHGAGHLAVVEISAVTGEIQRYLAVMLPPQPAAKQPIRLTPGEAEARARAVAEARPGYTVLGVDVRAVKTRSAFAPEGDPVYPVLIDATVNPPGSTHTFDADDYWEVHATTGAVYIGPGQTAASQGSD